MESPGVSNFETINGALSAMEQPLGGRIHNPSSEKGPVMQKRHNRNNKQRIKHDYLLA